MSIQAEVDEQADSVERITAVARRTPCYGFADLLWPPTPSFAVLATALIDDPGAMFETERRVVVFQRIGGELRYYAGGWCLRQERFVAEQNRVMAEGSELGVFGCVTDALAFAEGYLVAGHNFAALTVPRAVRYGRQPEQYKQAERVSASDPAN